MNKIKVSLKRKLFLLKERFLFSFPVKIIDKHLSFIIHEKHRPLIKIIKYVLTIISLGTSLIAFSNILISLSVAIVFFIIGSFIEKIGFKYLTMYVTPILFEDINLEKWIGCGFGYAEDDNNQQIPIITWIFSDKDEARKIHSLMLNWSHGNTIDENKLIYLSVVIDKNKNIYSLFLMPGLNRPGRRSLQNEVEKDKKSTKETFDDVHMPMIVMQYVKKTFTLTEDSYINVFRKRLPKECPVLLLFDYANDLSSKPENIDDLKNIVVFTFQIKDTEVLNRKDIEFCYTNI